MRAALKQRRGSQLRQNAGRWAAGSAGPGWAAVSAQLLRGPGRRSRAPVDARWQDVRKDSDGANLWVQLVEGGEVVESALQSDLHEELSPVDGGGKALGVPYRVDRVALVYGFRRRSLNLDLRAAGEPQTSANFIRFETWSIRWFVTNALFRSCCIRERDLRKFRSDSTELNRLIIFF